MANSSLVLRFLGVVLTVVGLFAGEASAQDAAKQPVPSQAAQAEITKKLAEIFDFDAAKKPEQKLEIAGELLKLSAEARNKPAEQFVLLRKTSELACEGGDAAMMIESLDAIARNFQLDGLQLKVAMLQRFAKDARTEESIESLMGAAQPVYQSAMGAQKYDVALRLVEAMYAAAVRPGGATYRKQLQDQRAELRKLAEQYKAFRDALAKIEANPGDKDASRVLGNWYCFVANDWEQGLFYLVESDDEATKAAAKKELETETPSAIDSAKIGDAWWDLAQKKTDEKLALMQHAAGWYRKAREQGVTGLAKIKLEKRLKELEEYVAAIEAEEEEKPSSITRPTRRKKSIVFRADMSMPPFPVGTKHGAAFPVQQVADPRGPFEGKGVYFQQKGATKKDIFYEIEWYPPVREIYYRGAAWKNMTMEVLDPKGNVVARFGPKDGGNHWLECKLVLPPKVGSKFVLHFHNEISTWFFINNIVFR